MKNLKKALEVGCLLIPLLSCGICGTYSLLLELYSPRPAGQCPSLDRFLLSEKAFPEGWETGPRDDALQWTDGLGRCNGVAIRQFKSSGGYAALRVIWAGSSWEAAIWMRTELWKFRGPRPGASWVGPRWYMSPMANEFQVRCESDPGLGITECYIFARYRDKVCIFEAAMAPAFEGGLTRDDLVKILKETDRLFEQGE